MYIMYVMYLYVRHFYCFCEIKEVPLDIYIQKIDTQIVKKFDLDCFNGSLI